MEKSLFTDGYEVFLQVLREARLASGLSQEDLAEEIGETQSFISKCERGERRIDVVELAAMCRALGITLAQFVEAYETALAGK